MPECLITGTVTDLDGNAAANARLTFTRLSGAVIAFEGEVRRPNTVSVQADNAGAVSFTLVPGNYRGVIETDRGSRAFNFGVPDQASANFVDLLDGIEAFTPFYLAQAKEYRDQAEEYAQIALASGGVLDVEDVADLLANTTITYTAGSTFAVSAGSVVRTRAEGFAYRVAASGASDHDVITAGGVKLYARPVAGVLNAASIAGSGGEVERLRIDASGNVGIGTTSPAARLEVRDTNATIVTSNSATRYGFMQWENTGGELRIGTDGAFGVRFDTNAGRKMTLDASGNLGLGVTPSAWGSNYKAIESAANSQFILAGGNVNGVGLLSNAHADNTNFLYKTTSPASYYSVDGATHRWYNAPSGTAGNPITFTQAMTLDASGRLLLGTTAPIASSSALVQSVNGFISSTDGTGLRLLNTTQTGGGNITANTGAAGGITLASDAGPMLFSAGGSERARIDANGRLGIGNTSPVVPLHVTGASMTTGVVYKNQPAPTSKGSAATLTIAELLTGIIQYTGAAANLTLPTGTDIEGGVPATFPTDMSFDFSVINTGSGTATIVTNTGITTVGGLTVAAGASGMFRVRKTAANTFTVYRIS